MNTPVCCPVFSPRARDQLLLYFTNLQRKHLFRYRTFIGTMVAAADAGKADEEAQKLERRRALRDLNRSPHASTRESVFDSAQLISTSSILQLHRVSLTLPLNATLP